jgi:hypothetical protein
MTPSNDNEALELGSGSVVPNLLEAVLWTSRLNEPGLTHPGAKTAD